MIYILFAFITIVILCVLLFFMLRFPYFYLYFFLIIYSLLPGYFAFELFHGAPLITALRLAILLLFLNTIIHRKVLVSSHNNYFGNSLISFKLKILFSLYVLSLIFSFVYGFIYSRIPFGEIIYVLNFLLENVIVFCLLVIYFSKRIIINKALFYFMLSGLILSVLSFIEYLFNFNIFSLVQLVHRTGVGITNYERLGVTRVETSFGHPIAYAMYLLMILPVTLFFIKKKTIYIFILLPILISFYLTLARGPLLSIIIAYSLVMLIVIFHNYFILKLNINLKWKTIFWSYAFGLLLLIVIVCVTFNPFDNVTITKAQSYITSIYNPEKVGDNFGNNTDAYDYRFFLIPNVFSTLGNDNLLLGMGTNYHRYFPGFNYLGWMQTSIDNQYLLILFDRGVFGLLTFVLIMLYFIPRYQEIVTDNLLRMLAIVIISYSIGLLSVAEIGTFKYLWIIFAFIYSWRRIRKRELTSSTFKVL